VSVVGLRGEKISEAGVDEGVVEMLRELLRDAESGQIIGIAAIAVRPNDEVGTFVRHRSKRHLLLAGTVYLQQDISKEE
jgi:hypothetical protein